MASFKAKAEKGEYQRPRHAKQVSNATWDSLVMLRKAAAGASPGAQGVNQADEVAYWRGRAEADGHDADTIRVVIEQGTRAQKRYGARWRD